MLLSDATDKKNVYLFDLHSEKVVQSFDSGAVAVHGLHETFKGSSSTQDPTFVCRNPQSVFLMDTREAAGRPTGNRLFGINYAKNAHIADIATTADGNILAGSLTGELRLFDGERNRDGDLKRAKTTLKYGRDAVLGVDVTADGSWVAATMPGYILAFPVKLAGLDKTGFEVALGKNKPPPVVLKLKAEDVRRHNLSTPVKFSTARFDATGTALVASTSDIAIIWQMSTVRQRKPVYKVKKADSFIADSSLAQDAGLVLAFKDSVEVLQPKQAVTRRV